MRHGTRVYRRLVVAGFRRQSTYRLAALGGLVANTTFGFLKVALLLAAVRAADGSLEGYDVGAVAAYVWVSQAMLGSVNLMGRNDLAERIRTGDVVVDFLRPVDVQGAFVATEVGRSLFTFLPRGLPTFTIGALVVGVPLAGGVAPVLGVLSVLLAITVSATTVFLVGVVGLWLVETRGVQLFYMIVSGFFAGLYLPIWFFPDWLVVAASATPFPSMLMYPTDILSGRVDTTGALGHLAAQVGWLVVTLVAGQLLVRAGRRRLEVQGG
ncbi:ABC transporter permease [Nocardioides litoris]|uniref:ABC transporter permease n=1 Tax=Nocardioides litoris TaxID=1926648 RepID=UPI00111E6283|nr:ABC transporter permease [Nocardioides litoris]